MTVSQWADQYRVLSPMTSAEPGQWHTDRTPYLRGIMDAFFDPLVGTITIMASTQVGKTESVYNMLGYAIDQDPGPTLIVMPREPDAKAVSKDRIRPMIELAPALADHITSDRDDVTKLEITLDRMIIYLCGSNSPAALSQKPVKYLFLDETDKYPRFSGEEADPIKLATERTRTFWNRKIVSCSTPTTKSGYIYREYNKSDKRSFFVPCPHCGGYQFLDFQQIKIPETDRDPDRIQIERLAWYECVYCHQQITDQMKQKMLLNGIWLPEVVKVDSKGRLPEQIIFPTTAHVGFHLNALYSPWLTFSEIIAEFLRSKDRIELLMNFVNSWLAQIWQEKIEETKPDKLRRLCQDYDRGTVPDGAIVLTGGVDVQKDYFVVNVRAWGVHPSSWLILDEIVSSWDDVIKILFGTSYPSVIPGIEPFQVRLSCIDTGYRTSEVYDICREFRSAARPIKGKDQLTGVPYKVSNIDKYPDGRPIMGGLLLYLLDTAYFKDKISRMVHASEETCRWRLHRSPSEEYLKQFCNEHKVLKRDRKKGTAYEVWQPVSDHAPTHHWDAEVYSIAAAEMLRVFTLQEADKPVPRPETVSVQQDEHKETWIPKRNGWIRNG
jgi:phage terminase large subunit GpA-like protein